MAANLSPKTSMNWLTDLCWLTLIGLLVYGLWLGSYPLFTPDEGRYSEVAREMLRTGDYITPRVNGIAFLDKPVLYYWLQALSMSLFGIHEWSIRFFPALFGLIGSLLTYGAGRFLYTRRTGILAALILLTSPLYFANAHYADLNLEVAVWISASLLLFVCATKTHSRYRALLFLAAYATAACAFLTKGLIGLAFPMMIIGTWIAILWRWRLLTTMYLVTGMLLFAAMVLPWYIQVQQANPAFLHYFFVTQQVSRFLSTQAFNNPTPFWFYLPIIFCGFFPWIIFFLWETKINFNRQLKNDDVSLFLYCWIGIVLLFFSIPHSKTIGYILPVFPPLALLAAKYIDDHFKAPLSRALTITLTASLFLISSVLLLISIYHWLHISQATNIHLYVMAGILLIAASLTIGYRHSLSRLFLIYFICNIVFLLTLTHAARYLNDSSVKPLALHLNHHLQPTDTVVMYYDYFQDAPLYLDKTVQIVYDWQADKIANKDNWASELWLGAPFQDTKSILISNADFTALWHSDRRVYVFVNKKFMEQFKRLAKHYFMLGKFGDNYLMCNQIRRLD